MGCGASVEAARSAPAEPIPIKNVDQSQGREDAGLGGIDGSKPLACAGAAKAPGADKAPATNIDLEGVLTKINSTILGGMDLLDSPFVDAVSQVLPAFGDTLQTIANVVVPPPGGQVVAAVIAIARIVIVEIQNNKTCIELAQSCHEILSYLVRPDNCAAIQKDPQMRNALDEFNLLAQDIEKFVKDVHGNKNWLSKLTAYADTRRELEDFKGRMEAITKLMKFQGTMGAFKFLQTAAAESEKVGQRVAELKSKYGCSDIKELTQNKDALQALRDLPGASDLDAIMVNQIANVQEKMDEQSNRGAWTLVKHQTMSHVWRDKMPLSDRVGWDFFWEAFPSAVCDKDIQIQLVDFFKDEAHKKLFQFAVDKEDERTVSVPEINQAFPPHEGVVEQVHKLKDTLVGSEDNKAIQLNHFPPDYVERREVHELADKIMASRVVLVTGFAGVGKATLAAAAARQLLAQHKIKDVFAVDMGKDIKELPSLIAKTLCPVLKDQSVEQVIAAKLMALRIKHEQFKEAGWPVVFILNDCEQVKDKDACKELQSRMQQMLDEVPGMHIVVCSREVLDLGKGIEPFVVQEPELAVGVDMFKSWYRKEISDEHVKQLVRTAACVPALIRVMVGYLQDEDYSLSDLLGASLDDAIEATSQAQAMKRVIITALEVLENGLTDLIIMADVLPSPFEPSVAQKVVDRTPIQFKPFQKRLQGCNLLSSNQEGLAVMPVVRDMIMLMLQNPTKPEFAKLKDWVLQAQAKRQSACLLFAQAVSDEVDLQFKGYDKSPLTACDALSRLKPAIQKVLADDDPELMANQKFQAAVLHMMRQLVYTPLIFDRPVIQDACTAKAAAWGNDPTGFAVAALFYVNSSKDEEHGHTPCLAKAEKVLTATASATEESAVIARSIALRAKALILRDKYEQLDVAVKCHYEALDLLEPLVQAGNLQAKIEKVVHLGEVTGTLDYIGDNGKNGKKHEEALQTGAKALAAASAVFGQAVDHPITAMVLGALGYNLRGLGKLKEAKEHHQRALAIRQSVLREHPETAMSLQQLALCLQDLGDLKRAEEFLLQSREIRIRCLGPKDLMVANTEDALYKLRMAQSKAAGDDEAKRKAALEHMRQVLTIRRVNLPAGNKKIVGPAEELVSLLEAEGRQDEAQRIRERYIPPQ